MASKYVDYRICEHLGVPCVPTSRYPDFSFPCVAKPDHGSLGVGVRIADAPEFGVIYQPFVDGRDVCVSIVGGRAVTAITRIPKQGEFRANMAQGATGVPAELTPVVVDVSERAAAALGMRVGCIDLIEGADGPLFLEANFGSQFKETSEITGVDVVGLAAAWRAGDARRIQEHGGFVLRKARHDDVFLPSREFRPFREQGPQLFWRRFADVGRVAVRLLDGAVAAYATTGPTGVFVNEAYRRIGIGRAMLGFLGAPPISINTSNDASLAMARSAGYETVFEEFNRQIMVRRQNANGN
jgi:GNAT superfamily N-acetyltransferase